MIMRRLNLKGNESLILSFVIILLLFSLDQFTKYLAARFLAPVGTAPFIPGVMELRYVRNEGAAFSILADAAWGRWFLIAVTAAALVAAAIYFLQKKPRSWLWRWTFILIMAGGIGNLADRIRQGFVVDFFATTFIQFAVFNVADCFVCIGAALFALNVLREEFGAFRSKPQKDGNTP